MVFFYVYGFFLSINTVAIAIAMIMAIIATTMYVIKSVVVAKFDADVTVGVAVAVGASTTKEVSEYDGQ